MVNRRSLGKVMDDDSYVCLARHYQARGLVLVFIELSVDGWLPNEYGKSGR